MSALLHFILVFITEIIFHFHGGHEQFHKGYCVWNISLLPPACKSFRGIIPSSIPTFLHFILVYIIEIIFYFHGIHEQFHIWYCVWNVSLLPSTCTEFIGIIPSSTPAFFSFHTGVHCSKDLFSWHSGTVPHRILCLECIPPQPGS